jgi:hypothetical protein
VHVVERTGMKQRLEVRHTAATRRPCPVKQLLDPRSQESTFELGLWAALIRLRVDRVHRRDHRDVVDVRPARWDASIMKDA